MSESTATLLDHLERRELQCRVERQAYQRWLAPLTRVRWAMVASSTILSAIAGATILSTSQLLENQNWQSIAGLCALGASLLSGLHAAFNCDRYQEDCRRLLQTFYSLEVAYQSVRTSDPAVLPVKAEALDARFEDAILNAATSPPAWCRRMLGAERAA